MNIIKRFNDSSYVYFDKGNFDNFCVYLKEYNQSPKAPKDKDYFNFFINLSKTYDANKIYSDFCEIYDKTDGEVKEEVLRLISEISESYLGDDVLAVDKWFTVLYMGMIAEENKAHTVLKKKIKRLGFHQIMFEGFTADAAANFSRDKNARLLMQECNKRGF